MKKQLTNKLFYLLVCSTLLLNESCRKMDTSISTSPTPEFNAQEEALVGKWTLKKSETYEIWGKDSTGQYLCTLIGISTCDSLCLVVFKGGNDKYKGVGAIGGCDTNASFIWRAKQPDKLVITSGNVYDILYLSHDSVAFSNVYVKDILTLKAIVYYKRY